MFQSLTEKFERVFAGIRSRGKLSEGDVRETVKEVRRALLEETPWGAKLFKRYFDIVRASIDRMDAQGRIRPDVDRLWLPFLFMFLETGTLLMDPYIKQILGQSGFEPDLWRRRYRAYGDMIARGVYTQPAANEETAR